MAKSKTKKNKCKCCCCSDECSVPSKKPAFKDLTREEYLMLRDNGYLYELYPEASGDVDADLGKKK